LLRLRRWVGDPLIEITLSVLTLSRLLADRGARGLGRLATADRRGFYIKLGTATLLISARRGLSGRSFLGVLIYNDRGPGVLITGLRRAPWSRRIGRPYPVWEAGRLGDSVVSVVVIRWRGSSG